MCHEIRQRAGTVFLDGQDCLYGVKAFLFHRTRGVLKGLYTKHVYDLEEREGRIYIPTNSTKQELTLALSKAYGENVTTVLKKHREAVVAGYHISPLCCSRTRRSVVHIKASTYFCPVSVRIIVGFLEEDILFFDGRDVSVEKFFLPHPEELDYKFSFYEIMREWYLWQYEKLYEEVMRRCISKSTQGSGRAASQNGNQEGGDL